MTIFTKKLKQHFMMPKTFLTCLAFLLQFSYLDAQVILNTQNSLDGTDNSLVIDVTAENFTDIAGMQFSINWDPAILDFEEVVNFNPLFENQIASMLNTAFATQGELPIVWLNGNPVGVTLESGAVLFSLKFNVQSNVPTEIFFDDTPTPIEFINNSGEVVGVSSNTNTIQTDGNLVNGKIFVDSGDCAFQAGETGLDNWMVQINDGTRNYFRRAKNGGEFSAFLQAGTYTFTLLYPENNYWTACQQVQQITLSEDNEKITTLNFGVTATLDCPALTVDISAPFVRRCFSNTYQVNYSNNGTQAAMDAYVLVQLPAEMTLQNPSLSVTSEGDNLYRFDIGEVAINTSGKFSFIVLVDCETTELGQTHCVSAKIFPDLVCAIPNAQWSKASLAIEGTCEGDLVKFKVKNVGDGDMLVPTQFVIIEDMIMLRQGNESFQLPSGETFEYETIANGATYRMEANQVLFHPTSKIIATAIEGCGVNDAGTFSKGMVNMFAAGDDSPFVDEDCQENIGAFDPNDKRAYPVGYGVPHYLDQNKKITYHIRFQNTGTDTAFNVVVIDTLDTALDMATFEPLTASHDYDVEILDENVVKFNFKDILLVDSFKNEPLSHGFVRFELEQQPDVELGTLIGSDAGIYFDFNKPVITNKPIHTIGREFIEVEIRTAVTDIPALKMNVYPNPFFHSAMVTIDSDKMKEGQFFLYDLNGRLLKQYEFRGHQFELLRSDLKAGMYLFEVQADGLMKGNGKLLAK